MAIENNNLEEQREEIVKLMQDKEFVNKISEIEDIAEFIKCFGDKGIKMSEQDVRMIFEEKAKNAEKLCDLPESELLNICGGADTIIINNNNVSSSSSSSGGGGGRRQKSGHNSESQPLTAIGGVAVGGALTVVGAILAGVAAYKWKKHGPESKM